MKTQTTIKTKPNARAEAVQTSIVINWEGLSQDEIIAMAQQSLIVKLQSKWRAEENIPTGEVTVNATDYKIGVRQPKKAADIFAIVGKLSAEEKAALLAKLSQ